MLQSNHPWQPHLLLWLLELHPRHGPPVFVHRVCLKIITPNGPKHGWELMSSFNYVKHMAVCQNLVPLVNIKIAGKWMFIPLKMVLIGIDPYPYDFSGSIVTRLPHVWPTPGMYKNAAPWLPPLPEHWKSGRPKPQKKAQRVGPGDPKSI